MDRASTRDVGRAGNGAEGPERHDSRGDGIWGAQPWRDADGTDRALVAFRAAFGTERAAAGVWAAPGRVNLIGEHTDYNGGLALPIALPHRTFVALAPRADDRIRLTTELDGGASWHGTLGDVAPGALSGWVAYTAGPAWALGEIGYDVPGFDAAVVSCVPLGAGLSSSAALECAVGLALADVAGEPLDGDDASRARLAEACMRAENEIAGAPTGGMDQAAALRAQAGHALLLDCRDGTARQVPFDLRSAGLTLLVIDTRAPHALVDGQYAERRRTCDEAAAALGVSTLREITDLDAALARLPDEISRRRVRHVGTEIDRVEKAVVALESGRWRDMGELMNASHRSLRDDYEVSVRALDVAVAAAQQAGALGARMTGGGFGGCAIALVDATAATDIAQAVGAAAAAAGVPTPVVHDVLPSAPGGLLSATLGPRP